VSKKIAKKFLVLSLLMAGLLFARYILAADFGTNAVSNGLGGSLAAGDPRELIGRIINIALGILGTVAVGLILYSGFLWMTSAGDEDKISTAKNILKNGIIGLLIILSSWAIATFILNQLGGTINGNGGSGCISGEIQSCGCGGSMACSNGTWGGCIGSNLQNCITPPTSCDSSPNPGCQAVDQICAAGYFCDNTCLCQTQGNLGDSCDADSSNLTCDADNTRCSEYLTCNPETCLCAGPPVITGLSPVGGFCEHAPSTPCAQDSDCGGDTCNLSAANGAADNFITIFGKNFGDYSATTSQVVFQGSSNPVNAALPATVNPLCVNSWRDDQIVVAVPAGVQSGPIEVINKDSLTDATADSYGPKLDDFVNNNINRPGLCYLDPNQGTLSSAVSYEGVNLYSGQAYFGNYQSNVRALDSSFTNPAGLSGTAATPNIQPGVSGSFVESKIANFPQKSNFLKFTKDHEVGEGPYIVSFSPSIGNGGQYVTIKGAGFGGAQGTSHVYFASGASKTEAAYDFPAICANSVWKDSQIIVKVPSTLGDDSYQIQVAIGSTTITTQNLNPNAFIFDHNSSLKTSLCKIDPEQGPMATPITLWGEYFGAVGSNGLVRFNYNQDASGPITKENDANIIETQVPAAAVTGPVKVIKNNEAGNDLNFSVAECTSNEECNNQVCCPANTYKKGQCVSDLDQCFVNIPTSVFEWGFSTSFEATTTPNFDSCLGLSKYLGTCYQGASCPNSPGACSSPGTNYQKIVGSCDISCQNAPGCTATTCTYNVALDKCVQNIASGVCDLEKSITFPASAYSFTVGPDAYTTKESCNSDGKWEIVSPTSCPIGWTRTSGDHCIQDNATCALCGANLSCNEVNTQGRCVSAKICADKDAKCIDNPIGSEADNCIVEVAPSCECCCRIGKDAEDCCAPLTCAGKCGSDITNNTNTYGSCSGCAAVGTTAADHDAACNCSGHASQFCDISSDHPAGICTDCSGITSQETCGDHSSACCFDSNKTATTTDDICRGTNGGAVVSTDKNSDNYGYCGYYNCFSTSTPPIGDPLVCASTTPLKIGFFKNVNTCVGDCPAGIGSDPCRAFDKNQVTCSNESNCCFDASSTNCLSGSQISGGANDGYCAYYDCETPPGNPLLCNPTPTTTPKFASTSTCATSCANPPGGAGLDCANQTATSTCNFGLCNFAGFACLLDTGEGGAYPSCGTCCCQVGETPDSCATALTPNLHCQADKGSCSGAGRGLCCGCSEDSDCGSISTTGCGGDTCCEARPKVVTTEPAAAATNVCRNAALKISFNENMDLSSFGNNFLLLEEKAYGSGVCPNGTYVTDNRLVEDLLNANNKNLVARLWDKLSLSVRHLFVRSSEQALATPPDPAKLYCAVPGAVSAVENGSQTDLIFTPVRLLAPATKYYAIVKGDEALNSKSGILSISGIGLNETGLDEGDGTFVASAAVKFNDRAYLNSYSFEFSTLSDQGLNGGVCAVDHVSINPASYLFKTTKNDLNEVDTDITNKTFDTKADRDKVLTAGAYSADDQLLFPVAGYNWDWNWVADNNSAVTLTDLSTLNAPLGISVANRRLVAAKPDISDAQTKVYATVNMDAYRPTAACGNACNAYFSGDGETKASDVYVFICDNPWPAIAWNGTWFPWNDVASNCSVNPANCENYNYKFYYCRDAGGAGTLDDLPAINNTPVVRGQGSTLLCSSDKTPCSSVNSPCGVDQNGDGSPDGLCFWNVLKESYFFRETVLSSVEFISALDTQKGGEIQLKWNSPDTATAYKIYYQKAGSGTMYSKELTTSSSCYLNGSTYVCGTNIIDLINDQPYIFKLTVISANRTESALSSGITATPTDQSKPHKPSKPIEDIRAKANEINFSWAANPISDKVAFYRLYRGVVSGVYGESFDSAPGATSLTFPLDKFPQSINYFALTAIGTNNHESDKSNELTVDLGNIK